MRFGVRPRRCNRQRLLGILQSLGEILCLEVRTAQIDECPREPFVAPGAFGMLERGEACSALSCTISLQVGKQGSATIDVCEGTFVAHGSSKVSRCFKLRRC